MQTPYDEVIYPDNPLPQTHPDRLATLASLYGLAAAPATGCRFLELGCGIGGNLAAIAYQFPDSEFVGIDLSAREIAIGQQSIAELGLKNLDLRHFSITDVTPEFGTFDYIVAHGVYSWVPALVREKVLEIFKQNLAPRGVAYVSYNAYPGSHFRNAARDIMNYHVRAMTDPGQKVREGRAVMGLMMEILPKEQTYSKILGEQLDRLNKMPDEVVFHDDLDEGATAFLFHKVIEAARRHGLQYLSEADFSQSHLGAMPDYVTRLLQQFPVTAVEEREQYLDFLASRGFRQSLLCHADVELKSEIDPSCVKNCYFAGSLAPEAAEVDPLLDGMVKFKTDRGVAFATGHALTKAAMLHIGSAWPQAVLFDDLVAAGLARLGGELARDKAGFDAEINTFAASLLRAYAADQVEMHLYPPHLTTTISERPEVSRLARKAAETGPEIINLRHKRVTIEDAAARRFLRLLDGTRDIDTLVTDLTKDLAMMRRDAEVATTPIPEVTRERVLRNLALLGSLSLLVA